MSHPQDKQDLRQALDDLMNQEREEGLERLAEAMRSQVERMTPKERARHWAMGFFMDLNASIEEAREQGRIRSSADLEHLQLKRFESFLEDVFRTPSAGQDDEGADPSTE
ncbi:hypothetical protein QR680_002501 [Steinernema hermaphroditum]|nr:hypothetical protein QR680_002501 [Steinernema hermaphroditum]